MDIKLLNNERIDKVNEGIRLIQRTDGLTFGTDALFLSAYIKQNNKKCVELGSGTGIISLLLLSRNKAQQIYAYEVQGSFADITQRNAVINGFEDRLTVLHKDIREATQSDINGDADVVFTNPPYMKNGAGLDNYTDEKNIARREIFGGIDDFCSAARRLLKFGGRFYCVYRPDRLIELLCSMRANNIEPKRITFIHADSDSSPSLILAEGRLGAGVELNVTRPLVIYSSKEHNQYTPDTSYIYEYGNFPDKRF